MILFFDSEHWPIELLLLLVAIVTTVLVIKFKKQMGVYMQVLGIDKRQLDNAFVAVNSFMRNKFPRIQRESGGWLYSSPSFDEIPNSPTKTNISERRMINHTVANNANCAVMSALGGCSEESQIILKGRYLHGLTGNIIKEKINVAGNSTYQNRVKKACLELADCLEGVRNYYHIPTDVIP